MAGPPTLDNGSIAERLDAFAALLDLVNERGYAARAYRRAAELIRATPAPVAELVRAGRAQELRGIGPGIDKKLRELVETGRIAELEQLERETSPELVGLGRLIGLAPHRMVELGRTLGVATAEELRAAAAEGRLRGVAGIGPKTEERVKAALAQGPPRAPRRGLLLNRAWALAEAIALPLGGEVAGDPRRWRDSCERFAVVCAAELPGPVLDRFAALGQVVSVVEREERRALGVTVEGVPVELVVAEPARFGTELVLATGNPDWVAALGRLPDAPTEAAVFSALGIPFFPPELREPPLRAQPPPEDLVTVEAIRGDLHVHTTWSDGKASVLEMAEAARERGYEYLAICDHTRAVSVVPGLDADDLRRQGEEIAAANEVMAPFRVLRGAECDVLADGTLDLPDDVLAELDWVQVSVHAGQRGSRETLTRRVEEAMLHPAARSLSHPTGRLINHRPSNAVDLERVVELALETGVALEVNGLPDRLDLRDEHVRAALEAGARITCSTDAHSVRGLGNMRLSVATARRGWARVGDVLNTRPLDEVLAARKRPVG